MQVYNDELYHYGKRGMKWGHRSSKSTINKKTTSSKQKKSVQEHSAVGIKAAGKAISIIGQMAARAHTNNQAMQLSKMIFPD